mmetsp:Transcript_3745/g.8320  ORF Transcript_3745/g.8320 Transcript_3745/m.8320 type:complete len:292 (-) Transcript_3745:946-1821(-)
MSIRQPPQIRIGSHPLFLIHLRRRPHRIPQILRHPPMRRKHPRPDMAINRIPLQRIHPTPIPIQRHTQTPPLQLQIGGHTTLIQPLVGIVDKAILSVSKCHIGNARLLIRDPHGGIPRSSFAPLGNVVHPTFLGGMQGGFGGILIVDAFDDVDLSVDRPIGLVGEPEGGPGAASGGHVSEVDDEESAVEAAVAFEADGVAGALGAGAGGEDDEGFGGEVGGVWLEGGYVVGGGGGGCGVGGEVGVEWFEFGWWVGGRGGVGSSIVVRGVDLEMAIGHLLLGCGLYLVVFRL